MFPYDRRLLRCHPFWGQLRSPISDGDIHTTSNKQCFWLCCECDHVFKAALNNVTRSSCRCAMHSNALKACNRMRYTGNIPVMLTRPIRTGLLQRVDNDDLVKLIASFINCDNRDAVAQGYIHEVGQFPKQQLLDGGFWWEDNYYRKNGTRYKPESNKRSRKASGVDNTSSCSINHVYDKEVSSTNNCEQGEDQSHHLGPVEEAGQPTVWRNPADHLWDDVVHAIRDDLRAFWGLWDTDIAPRLDRGLPVTYKDAEEWNGDNVDVVLVFSRLRCLTSEVKTITDTYVPRTSIEERVLNRVQSLLRDLRTETQASMRMFVEELMVYAAVTDFVYPRPVD